MADKTKSKKLKYTNTLVKNQVEHIQNKVLVGTPTLGLIRMEWAAARYGQIIPSNYSKVDMIQYMNSYIPMRYSVADGQNLIVQEAVTRGYQWLILIEDDTIPPPDAFVRFNEYIREGKYPVVSGLYFTRSDPAEPMVYRGRGNSFYTDWKLGDKVWVDGVPTGMLLLDMRLIRSVWEQSEEYMVGTGPGQFKARKVFETPGKTWFNEEKGSQEMLVGTSDLDFCTRVIEGGYLNEHWPTLAKKKYPFCVDTAINCMHIERLTGDQYPLGGILQWCQMNGCI
jgi:hypothetical protein